MLFPSGYDNILPILTSTAFQKKGCMRKISSNDHEFIPFIQASVRMVGLVLALLSVFTTLLILGPSLSFKAAAIDPSQVTIPWKAPDIKTIPNDDAGRRISYGRELIVNTAHYLGPNGTVSKMSNGMNCQNCHLDAGTRLFGNNFSAVASTYPKYRPRYGSIESIEKRVNDCLERSLNGLALDSTSYEMRAFVAYLEWVGKDVKKGVTPNGSGGRPLPYLDRVTNPENGKLIYDQKCALCHGSQGQGLLKGDSSSWLNPPLWGERSYNVGAGLYRLSRFAEFVKSNMPFGSVIDTPQLSDEEAWDLAAYVNSMPRPGMNLDKDWPDISKKPPDYPFGPFTDSFSTEQHKYGPFNPILEAQKKLKEDQEKKSGDRE